MGELGDEHDHQHHGGHSRAEEVHHAGSLHAPSFAPVLLDAERAVPVQHHPGLSDGEGDEHPDHVELDQGRHGGVETPDEGDGRHGQQHDPVGIGQPVAAGVELPGQITVLGEDRSQARETVERGVRGQEQDRQGGDDDHVETRNEPVTEDRARQLSRHGHRRGVDGRAVRLQVVGSCQFVDQVHAGQVGQQDDPDEHGHSDQPEQPEHRGGVAALGGAERWHAVGHGLHAGQRGAARREGPGDDRDQHPPEGLVGALGTDHRQVGGLALQRMSQDQDPEESDGEHQEH